MTIGLPPRITMPNSVDWTYWASYEDSVAASGYQVARLLDREPVSIGSPVTATAKPAHIWLRYHDNNDRAYGVVTLPWPSYVTTDPTSRASIAIAVAALLRNPGEPEVPRTSTGGQVLLGGTWYPAATVAVDAEVSVRTALLPAGRAIAVWGAAEHLGHALVDV
ncbi:hypothetical protein ACFXPS_17025 [Nocardia sp. NPDC059091]|uniref:hypothetical protein n=1 Tax=unclassified Nocardia TaxID=2637762 RepID=UPI0036B37A71